ncbi:MAG: PEGA domain-containing protein [Patescibacteria group bacterium]|nr:PEGA domain-containing protein [Patescibacteria group bacterium]
MKISARLSIKIIFVLIFLTVAPLIIAYTMGYRYNFTSGQMQHTGVLVINSNPTDAEIFINGQPEKQRTPAIIKKINPNEYTVEIKKTNFIPWSKKLTVNSGESTFADMVTLFMDSDPSLLIERKIASSSFSPDRSSLIYVIKESSWAEIWIFTTKRREFSLIERRNLDDFNDASIVWAPGSSKIFFEIQKPGGKEQLIYDVSDGSIVNLLQYLEKPAERFFWSKTSDDVFYVVNDTNLSAINLPTGQITPLFSGSTEYFVRGDKIFSIIKNNGKIILSVSDINNPLAGSTILYELPHGNYTFEDSGFPYLMLKRDNRELLLFDTSAPFTEPILQEEASGYSWYTSNQGEKKLLYFKDFEIWIFYPKSKYNELITRFASQIKNASWHRNGEYIFFDFGDGIKVIELDSREKRNIFDLVNEATIADFAVDYNSENLYFIGIWQNSLGLHYLPLI